MFITITNIMFIAYNRANLLLRANTVMRKHHLKTYKLSVTFCPLPIKISPRTSSKVPPKESPPKQDRLDDLFDCLDSQGILESQGSFGSFDGDFQPPLLDMPLMDDAEFQAEESIRQDASVRVCV